MLGYYAVLIGGMYAVIGLAVTDYRMTALGIWMAIAGVTTVYFALRYPEWFK
jgi:energy-converting hydrogenase Eha subunit E